MKDKDNVVPHPALDNMDKIMLLATTNPMVKKKMEAVQAGQTPYFIALEEIVVELGEQMQHLRNTYRNK